VTLVTSRNWRVPPWSAVLPLVISGVLLFFAFQGVNWPQVLATLRRGRVDLLALAGLVLTIAYVMRGMRWRAVLSAVGQIAPMTMFWATMAGYLGNNLLPARAGELIRSVLLGRQTGLSTSYVLATALLERLVDVVALVIIGLLALLVLETVPDWLLTAVSVAGVIGLVGLTGARFLPRFDQRLIAYIAQLPISTRFGTSLTALSSQFLLGMGALKNRKQRMNVAALTVIIWVLDVMFALVIALAFDLPLSVPQAMVLLAALGLASAVPSTPGYVGVYQFVAVTVLVPFGFSRDQALVQIIGLQGIAYGVEIVWGTLGLWCLTRPHGELPWRPLAAAQAVE
jgi:glycosyltransferase 2 family protein